MYGENTVIPNLQCLLPVSGDSTPRAKVQCLKPRSVKLQHKQVSTVQCPRFIHCFTLNISGLNTLGNLLLLLDFSTPMFIYMTLYAESNFWNRWSSKLIKYLLAIFLTSWGEGRNQLRWRKDSIPFTSCFKALPLVMEADTKVCYIKYPTTGKTVITSQICPLATNPFPSSKVLRS